MIYYLCVPGLIFLMRHNLMRHQIHCSWLFRRGDLTQRQKNDLVCKGGLGVFQQWELPEFFFGGRLGIICFAFFSRQSLLLVLPGNITRCFPFLPLLVFVGCRHKHYALESIFILEAVLLTTHKIISFWVKLVLSSVFEAPFDEAVRFAAGCSWGLLASQIIGSIFLKGGGQSDDCWFGIFSLCAPKSCGFVFNVHVNDINQTLSCIECGGVLDILTLLLLHICNKIIAAVLESSSKIRVFIRWIS